MTLLGFLVLLLIAAICGAIGQALAGYSLSGCLVSTAVGLIGALLGLWLARLLDLPLFFAITIQAQTFPIIWSIIGATLFAVILGLLTRRRRYVRR